MRYLLIVSYLALCPLNVICGSLYDRLGVSSTATDKEIKKAYRKKALKEHPDRNKSPDAADRFKDLQFAYDCLSDKEKRRRYDAMGEKGCTQEGGDPFDGDNVFSSFFGSMFRHGDGHDREETRRGGDVTSELPVTLEEIYIGEFIEVVRSKSVKKSKPGTRECNCRMEMKTRAVGPGQFQMIQQRVCSQCPNFEFVLQNRVLEVEVEVGVADGSVYPFPGEGEPHADGDNGDLKFVIRQQPHPIFHRHGDDLYTNVTISLVDALTGFSFEMSHLDGHKIKVKREKITWPGAILTVPREGMPVYEENDKKGNLFITFDVIFPRNRELKPKEKESIKTIFSGDAKFTSPSVLGYGVPMTQPQGLADGLSGPIAYNGFRSSGPGGRHLTNSLS